MPFIVTQKKHQIEIITMKNYGKKIGKQKRNWPKRKSRSVTDSVSRHTRSHYFHNCAKMNHKIFNQFYDLVFFSIKSLFSLTSTKEQRRLYWTDVWSVSFIQFKFLLYFSIECDHFCHTNFDHFLDFVLQ